MTLNFSLKYLLVILFLLFVLFFLVYYIIQRNKNKNVENDEIFDTDDNNDLIDMQKSSIELESLAKNKQMEITSYEDEQEEKAIISYDELLAQTQNVSINYSDSLIDDDIVIKKVDLEKTGKIELDPIKQEENSKVSVSYEHEEEFLEALKQLQSLLN